MASSAIKPSFQDAHVFDVDPNTGFMAPGVGPLSRLPAQWEPWETILDAAINAKIQPGDKPGITEQETAVSQAWRDGARKVRVTPFPLFQPM